MGKIEELEFLFRSLKHDVGTLKAEKIKTDEQIEKLNSTIDYMWRNMLVYDRRPV